MSEITRYLLQVELERNCKLEGEIRDLLRTTHDICAKYVHPDFFPHAMKEIEIFIAKQTQPEGG